MPLSQEATHINAEVEAIKRKVRRLAENHSRTFHCGSGVAEALREVGISETADQISVVVEYTVLDTQYESTLSFDKVQLHGKTHIKQCEWVAEQLAPSLIVGDTQVEIDIDIIVTDLNEVEKRLPDGYRFYKTYGGRVAHILVPGLRNALCEQIFVGSSGVGAQEVAEGTAVCKQCKRKASAFDLFDDFDVETV